MANNYGVFRSDNMQCTKNGHIKSGRYVVGSTETAIENANLVKLDSLLSASTDREIWKVVAPGAVTTPNCYIVASPELIYDESLKSSGALCEFKNAAGANITLLGVAVGDTFAVSDSAIAQIDGADNPTVGKYVTPSATGTLWKEVATIEDNEVFYGQIIARELYKNGAYLNVIQMISVN